MPRHPSDPPKHISEIEAYAIEWAVEDPDRYERLARSNAGGDVVEDPDDTRYWSENRKRRTKVIPNTVITCVLSVPRQDTERVTNALRAAPGLKKDAMYLSKAAQGADGVSTIQDEAVKLRLWVEELERLITTTVAKAINLGADPVIGKNMLSDLATARHKHKTTTNQVHEIMTALREKRTDVAADLLRKLPEEEW